MTLHFITAELRVCVCIVYVAGQQKLKCKQISKKIKIKTNENMRTTSLFFLTISKFIKCFINKKVKSTSVILGRRTICLLSSEIYSQNSIFRYS